MKITVWLSLIHISLIKALEENGIGRPSTYAPTISTILARGYVVREAKTLFPTELGSIVTKLMEEFFKNIVDVDFTANMETQLDDVEDGKRDWVSILNEFYGPFEKTLEAVSYTHLDVYKRQVWKSTTAIPSTAPTIRRQRFMRGLMD